MRRSAFLLLLPLLLPLVTSDDVASTSSTRATSESKSEPSTLVEQEHPPKGQIIAHDVTGEAIPPAMKAISKASGAEPSLGLHGITEQQLNLRYYNFICSTHFHLDCKITETLQICMKDRYVAVLGLPLAFESGSPDLLTLGKWMRQCDRNDQDMNQDAMRIIRKRIHLQNENNWEGVFRAARSAAPMLLAVSVITVNFLIF
ncbi:unnamed protein product [Caenorhabditis sp. 36 PRJEB53466]|nr:unnamed protein product [Caenorhabditis sp. 36 PRJEB53466]